MFYNSYLIKDYMKYNFRHYNARVVLEAAEGWVKHLRNKNKMFLTLAGALSTAEIGCSLNKMILNDKVHGICCTAANLEEDLFNMIAYNSYLKINTWRTLKEKDELFLLNHGYNRVTDSCIPEREAMRKIEKIITIYWIKSEQNNKMNFPHEYLYQFILSTYMKKLYEIKTSNSWLIAAAQKNLNLFVPGWEDSTLGNMFVSLSLRGKIKNLDIMKLGLYSMRKLISWYKYESKSSSIGFFQIGGGIAGDFPICVVPLINCDLKDDIKLWSYFCQISESTTSYGSYSGATPNEKITWGKLDDKSPKYIIESDATIVAPLIFNYVLVS